MAGHSSGSVSPSRDKFRGAQATRDGSVLVFRNADTLTIHDVSAPLARGVVTGHLDAVRDLVFSRDGARLYTASEDGTVREWDVEVGRCLRTFDDFPVGVAALTPTKDGKGLFVLDTAGRLQRLDLTTGAARSLATFLVEKGSTMRLRHVGDALAIQNLTSSQIRLFALDDEKEKRKRRWLSAHAIHRQREESFFASAGELRRSCAGEKKDEVIGKLATRTTAMACSPDGRLLALLRSGSGYFQPQRALLVEVFDIQKKQAIRSWSVESMDADLLVYSPTGAALAVAGGSRYRGAATLSVWDAATGRMLACPVGHLQRVTAVAFSPDGRTLASADEAGVVRLWNIGR